MKLHELLREGVLKTGEWVVRKRFYKTHNKICNFVQNTKYLCNVDLVEGNLQDKCV